MINYKDMTTVPYDKEFIVLENPNRTLNVLPPGTIVTRVGELENLNNKYLDDARSICFKISGQAYDVPEHNWSYYSAKDLQEVKND